MAREYEKLVNERQEKSRENLHLRMESSSSQSAVGLMTNKVERMRGEEQATKDEARGAMLAVEPGVQSLQDRLSKDENADPKLQRGWNKPKIMYVKLDKGNALCPRYTRNR